MYCHPLDIPDEVIAAQEAGELVVFVGAGVSCGGMSNLPLFGGLTDQIGLAIGRTREEARKDYDIVLGEWAEAHQARVHEAARTIIGDRTSHPNDAHRLLLQLFKKEEHVRIVTTNYDRHFTTAALELGIELHQYRAPALPLGDDFQGIVYLHGNVDDIPKRLVLTDADFGRAYLSQGWARTFLQALYAKFHVLFVGYSHADSLLSYLARGLPARDRNRRHALQPQGDHPRWKQLGIGVLPYPIAVGPDEHANLTVGLARWVSLSAHRPQDVRDQIHQVVDAVEGPAVVVGGEGAPSAIQLGRDGEDVLRRALREPTSAGWFLDRAKDLRWIRWLHESRLLPALTVDVGAEPNSAAKEVKARMIGWTVDRLLTTDKPDALELFAMLGGAVGPTAWFRMIRTLVVDQTTSPAWRSPFFDHWLVAVRHGCKPGMDRTFLPELIKKLAVNGNTEHALGLFDQLLRVRVEWKRPWSLRQETLTYAAEPKLVCELHELREAWEALQPLRNAGVDERLGRVLTTCIEELYAALGPLGERLDPICGLRTIVDEPRGPHDPSDAEAFVGVMLISVIRARAATANGLGEAQILRWLAAPQPGWQRFAYFALRVDVTIPASRKAEIILQQRLIYPAAWQLQHDPSALAAAVYGGLDTEGKRHLLEAIIAGPHLPARGDRTPKQTFEAELQLRNGFLHRLAFGHRDDVEISSAFARLGLTLPAVVPPHSEDEDIGDEFGLVPDVELSPKTVKELLAASPASQIDYFLSYQGEGTAWAGRNRAGLLGAILVAANESADWARELIGALIERRIITGDLWDRLVWGLNWHTKDPEFRRWLLIDVVSRLDSANWSPSEWNGWTFHLFRLGNSETLKSLAFEEWDVLLNWSLRAWEALRQAGLPADQEVVGHEILGKSINHPVGRVVEFWIQYVDQRRRSDPESPYDWPEQLRGPVAQLMAIEGETRLLGLAIIGQFLSFVRYALPVWTRDVIYPLLDVATHPRDSTALWSSWLCYGRISVELAQELSAPLEQSHRQLLVAGGQTSNRFISILAVFATSPFAPADVERWLRTCLGDATPAQRGRWNSEVARCMRDQTADRQRAVWEGWAKAHLTSCNLGRWGTPSAEEFRGFLNWPIAFVAAAEEAFSLVQALPIQTVQLLDVLFDFKRSGIAKTAPNFAARYLRWLFEAVATDRYGYFEIEEIVEQLTVNDSNRDDLQSLANRFLTLGLTSFGDRLLAKLRATPARAADNPT